MDNVIIHNNKKYSVDEIKRDFDVINAYMLENASNADDIGNYSLGLTRKTRVRSKYDALKYVFCGLVKCYDYDEESRLIFRASDICKKYVNADKFKKPSQTKDESENGDYSRAFRIFQTKVMLEIEDFVIAYANPEWSEIYLLYVPHCNKEAHLAILHSCEAE